MRLKEGEHASRTLLFSDVFWPSLSADSKFDLAHAWGETSLPEEDGCHGCRR